MAIISIVKMEKTHVSDLLDIESLCFPVGWSSYTLNSILEDERSHFYTMLSDDTIIGYGGVRIVLDEANLDNIAIHPNFQGQGLGEKLLEFLIELSKNHDVVKITLEVRESNLSAINMYKKWGFKQVGQRPGYYTKPEETAILMDLEVQNES